MTGKTCIVTGANSGVGYFTALGLAKTGARVVMVCRSRERGGEALDTIRKETGSKSVELMIADFSSQTSIRTFAGEFVKRHPRLDVLINNAGIIAGPRVVTPEGLEYTFALNHIGYFLTTALLLPHLKKSAPARIINVASEGHRMGRIRFDDLQMERGYTAMKAYNQSKLANVLFTYELARRLEGTGISANCLHPGAVGSNFGGTSVWWMRVGMKLGKPFLLTPEKAARGPVYLATSSEVANVTGKYFWNKRVMPSSGRSHNNEDAGKLWEVSERLVGVR
ncbi:MAG: SDR family oxidoreductase [Nitrospirae bacterium]|nr:SDR family oxidoreductase [Nitrospirota bacterium]